MFASGITPSVMKEIQTRSEKLRVPVQQYLKNVAREPENAHTAYYSKLFNRVPFNPSNVQVQRSAYMTTELGRGQVPNAMYTGLVDQNQQAFNGYNSLNQVRLGQSSYGSNIINIGANEMQKTLLGSNAYPVYNDGSINLLSYGNGMGHGLMTSANGITGSLSQNYGSSFGNQSFKYGLGNGGMASLSNSNVSWNSSTCYPPRYNSHGIQLNGGSQFVGTGIKGGYNSIGTRTTFGNNYRSSFAMNGTQNANMHNNNSFGLVNNGTQNANMHNNNSFGLINGTQNTNMHAGMKPLGHGNIVAGTGYVSDPHLQSFNNNANSRNANAAENERQYNSSSITEGDVDKLQDDLSELFMMVQNMEFLNQIEDTPNVSEYLNSDFSVSTQVMQPPEQDSDKFVDWEFVDRFWVESDFSGSLNNSAIDQAS
ncbi:hypothetical protein TanjilG_14962 [Lupinus angustifolius]|uniref:Uncharacterized protein n=1 Tax=Lupinus angustifolius TaxID=3871 RepID=A0A394DBR7_LUPAN|nr:hypothetical protein TanjilG_14962 [Lupinus angustifolius]